MRMFAVLFILLMVSSIVGGCSSYLRQIEPSSAAANERFRMSLEEPGGPAMETSISKEDQSCKGLRSKYRLWGGFAVGVGAISGGSGLSSAFPDNQTARIGLGVSSAVFAVVGAVSVFLRDSIAAEIKEKNCK